MKAIHMLHVEDVVEYATELVAGFHNLTDADGSFRLVVDSCHTVEEALERLRAHGPTYDIALVDAELVERHGVTDADVVEKRGISVLAEAKRANLHLARILYSGKRHIDAEDLTLDVHDEFWVRDRMFAALQQWCSKRARSCDLAADGACLWSRPPPLANLPSSPYCYASLPHSPEADFQVRAAVIMDRVAGQWGGMRTVVTGLHAADNALEHIRYGIRHCTVFLADLFQKRSNVLIEIGMAVAMNRVVVLLSPGTPDSDPVPYNVSYRKAIWYGDSVETEYLAPELRKWYRQWSQTRPLR